MAGAGVNVTEVPEHIAPAGLAVILRLAATFGFTVTIIEFDVAGFPEIHDAFEVMMHLMVSFVVNTDVVNVLPVATLALFFIH